MQLQHPVSLAAEERHEDQAVIGKSQPTPGQWARRVPAPVPDGGVEREAVEQLELGVERCGRADPLDLTSKRGPRLLPEWTEGLPSAQQGGDVAPQPAGRGPLGLVPSHVAVRDDAAVDRGQHGVLVRRDHPLDAVLE